jgi:RNAse (barnase) inhibitor barstar
MANTSFNLTTLDFDEIKTNLKTFLKSKPQFSYVDFEGSNINALIDVMSYNTYLNSFYLNMVE